jgi:hypothetical protein
VEDSVLKGGIRHQSGALRAISEEFLAMFPGFRGIVIFFLEYQLGELLGRGGSTLGGVKLPPLSGVLEGIGWAAAFYTVLDILARSLPVAGNFT